MAPRRGPRTTTAVPHADNTSATTTGGGGGDDDDRINRAKATQLAAKIRAIEKRRTTLATEFYEEVIKPTSDGNGNDDNFLSPLAEHLWKERVEVEAERDQLMTGGVFDSFTKSTSNSVTPTPTSATRSAAATSQSCSAHADAVRILTHKQQQRVENVDGDDAGLDIEFLHATNSSQNVAGRKITTRSKKTITPVAKKTTAATKQARVAVQDPKALRRAVADEILRQQLQRQHDGLPKLPAYQARRIFNTTTSMQKRALQTYEADTHQHLKLPLEVGEATMLNICRSVAMRLTNMEKKNQRDLQQATATNDAAAEDEDVESDTEEEYDAFDTDDEDDEEEEDWASASKKKRHAAQSSSRSARRRSSRVRRRTRMYPDTYDADYSSNILGNPLSTSTSSTIDETDYEPHQYNTRRPCKKRPYYDENSSTENIRSSSSSIGIMNDDSGLALGGGGGDKKVSRRRRSEADDDESVLSAAAAAATKNVDNEKIVGMPAQQQKLHAPVTSSASTSIAPLQPTASATDAAGDAAATVLNLKAEDAELRSSSTPISSLQPAASACSATTSAAAAVINLNVKDEQRRRSLSPPTMTPQRLSLHKKLISNIIRNGIPAASGATSTNNDAIDAASAAATRELSIATSSSSSSSDSSSSGSGLVNDAEVKKNSVSQQHKASSSCHQSKVLNKKRPADDGEDDDDDREGFWGDVRTVLGRK